ncbi:MAG: LacI family transcriptional regulator [Chloroflexi bacterium HGW-Chloroflexi-1]|nr:MAG: LacI family transcriptional regulator [Chloroflexi bacterium HGW-Chloroflexi-1]
MGQKITLHDVAEKANVSIGTASMALNAKPGVSPETRTRVLEAATELGYQVRIPVSVLSLRQLSTVGLVVKEDPGRAPKVNPFYSYVLAGVEAECRRQNLNLMYASVPVDNYNRISALPRMLVENRVDGLLIVGSFLDDAIAELAEQAGQIVSLVDSYTATKAFDSVVSDNFGGAHAAVSHLIQMGHRCIGLIGSTPDAYPSIRDRRNGYLRALKDHGFRETFIEDGDLTSEAAYQATRRLWEREPSLTAIFGCNDEVAIAAMRAALDSGRRVPEDLSIVGFDDIDLVQQVIPPLTTVHVDKLLMGALAVRQLVDRAQNPTRATITTVLNVHLIQRQSVRAPK